MAPLWRFLLATAYLVVAVESLIVPSEAFDGLVAADEKTRRSASPAHLGPALFQVESRASPDEKKGTTGSGQDKADKHQNPKPDKSSGKKKDSNKSKDANKKKDPKKAKGTGKKSGSGHTTGKTGGDDAKTSTGLWRAGLGTYFDDPCLIYDDKSKYWYVFSTQTCFYPHGPVYKSPSLDKGSMKWSRVDTYVDKNVGGPDVISLGGQYVMSYGDGDHDITVHTSTSLDGGWGNKKTLIQRTPGGDKAHEHNVGDASFLNDRGKIYTVYARKVFDSQSKPKRHLESHLELQELDPTGTSPKAGAKPKVLQRARPAKKGQTNPDLNIEAPFLVHKDGWYYLTFSTREYTTSHYNTQYVSSKTLDGLSNPNAQWHSLLHSGIHADGAVLDGPGSMSVGRGGNKDYIAFHIIGKGKNTCPKKKSKLEREVAAEDKKHKKPKKIHRELWLGVVKFDKGKMTIA